ncbi:MAG: hypothetical protein GY729_02940 [Desulfobacteraceae bacterium]|nr:hypothetical protein [Desulfobacteraceae bacterium]
MEYDLIVNSEKTLVEAKIQDREITLQKEEKPLTASFERVSDHQILLNINGTQLNAYVGGGKDVKTIIIDGRTYYIRDADSLAQAPAGKKGFKGGAKTVCAPMPAMVISILAKEGQMVEKGQKLVIVSAMKMETSLFAPFDGKVTKINAKEGDKVMPTDILVDIEQKKEPAEETNE